MRDFINILIVVVVLALVGAAGFFVGRKYPPTEATVATTVATTQADSGGEDEPKAVPTVTVTPIVFDSITRSIVSYGTISAQPANVAVLSVPVECRVVRVLAMPGQRLESESSVIEIEPSADTRQQVRAAQAALDAAQKDLAQTQQRFADHLATNQDLLQSQTNLDAAKIKSDSLSDYATGGTRQLKASGLIAKVDVQQGQVVPAGSPLVEVAAGNQIQARLGVEPSDIDQFHKDDTITINSVATPDKTFAGKVDLITQSINPQTSLIDVFVSLPGDCKLPLEDFVRGERDVVSKKGLIVPRVAVVPGDAGVRVFVIDTNNCEDHPCKVVFQNDDFCEIEGDDLDPGDDVVISGSLELADDMKVHTVHASAATTHASTQASTQPATEEKK